MMESPDERTERDLGLDEPHAIVGMVRRRGIVDDEEHACDGLEEKQEEGGGAEHVDPARAAGNRLVEQRTLDRLQAQPAVEPLIEAGWHLSLQMLTVVR